jgi:hypothetical protein
MLKIAFQLGLQRALAEAGRSEEQLTKEALGQGAMKALRGAGEWALKNKKLSIPAAVAGAGALGTGGYFAGKHLLKEEEPGFLEQAGDLAHGLTSDPQLMQGLLGMATGMGGSPGGAMGLAGGQPFPPDPNAMSYGAQMGAADPYADPYMTQGYGAHQPLQY